MYTTEVKWVWTLKQSSLDTQRTQFKHTQRKSDSNAVKEGQETTGRSPSWFVTTFNEIGLSSNQEADIHRMDKQDPINFPSKDTQLKVKYTTYRQ